MKIAHIAAAWLCGLSALCLPTLCLAAVPLEHFAKLAAYEQIAISPSGEHVAIKTPMDDRSGVAIVRLDDMKMTGALKLSQGFHVYDLHWAGPERVLIELAQTFGALDAPRPTGELYTINADGGDKKYLFGFRGAKATGSHIKKVTQKYASAHLVDPLLDQPDHALVAINVWANGPNGYTSVERIDLRSGKRVPVTTAPAPGYSAFATDRDGAVRYAIAPTENLTGLQSFRLSAKGDEWQPLSRGERAGATIAPLGVWSNRALLASNEAGDRLCLVEHDLARDKRKTVVCDPTVDLTRVILSFDRRDAIAAIFDDGRPSYRFLNSGHPNEKELRDLLKAFGGEFVEPVSASADGQRVILKVSSDRNPGEYFLFDRKSGAVKFLIAQRAWIKPEQMAGQQPRTLKARDGTKLHGYLTLPEQASPKGLVVLPHGGPRGIRDTWQWHADVQMLASRGYAVLQPNFRGSGGYGARFENAGRYAWGTTMIDDIVDATRVVLADKALGLKTACIVGSSYGGYAALMAAVREPELFACAVAEAGIYDLVEWRKTSDVSGSRFGRNYIADQVGRDDKHLRVQSPLTHIDNLQAPVLIIHGREDERVPFSQAERLRKALKKRRHPHEWLAVRGEGHGFYEVENRVKRLEAIEAFLRQHL